MCRIINGISTYTGRIRTVLAVFSSPIKRVRITAISKRKKKRCGGRWLISRDNQKEIKYVSINSARNVRFSTCRGGINHRLLAIRELLKRATHVKTSRYFNSPCRYAARLNILRLSRARDETRVNSRVFGRCERVRLPTSTNESSVGEKLNG